MVIAKDAAVDAESNLWNVSRSYLRRRARSGIESSCPWAPWSSLLLLIVYVARAIRSLAGSADCCSCRWPDASQVAYGNSEIPQYGRLMLWVLVDTTVVVRAHLRPAGTVDAVVRVQLTSGTTCWTSISYSKQH
jgi:hypothetical protein